MPSMAGVRVVDLRQTAPIARPGAGFANGFTRRPRAVPTGVSAASSGSSVMPWPAATIWRKVSRLVAR